MNPFNRIRRVRAIILCCATTVLWASNTFSSDTYSAQVIARGLNRPTGIAVRGGDTIYFTEIPTPGIPGGGNAVKELRLGTQSIRVIHQGEPEPVNIAVDHSGILYWTCKSAGVILEQAPHPVASPAAALLTGLDKPSGIATDKHGNVYFTQVPAPGVAGGANSLSVVSVYDTSSIVLVSDGEPEPVDVAASDRGVLYWTCRTAGVILTRNQHGTVSLLLGGLNQPVGLALDEQRDLLYWTEVPTPGIPGSMGGSNKVWVHDLRKNITTLVDSGDPEPTDVAVAPNGRVYWTCSSAGVIVEAVRR